jgi:8-oxo-dGTP diphosphatase
MPSVTADCIITRQVGGRIELLLIKRMREPFRDKWALPGGFVEIEEDLLEGAERELYEETGITDINLQQFRTFGKPGRDPRGRTISVVYHGSFQSHASQVKAGDDAAEAQWFEISKLPNLAFDHQHIIDEYLKSEEV